MSDANLFYFLNKSEKKGIWLKMDKYCYLIWL